MFHYLFTNDLRISKLESALIEAGDCFLTDTVPSAAQDKNANNNMNTLGFYFNLTRNSVCSKECSNKNIRKVVLNFIKKFQFPNPRTNESLQDAISDGIQLAPMRVIVQMLYYLTMIDKSNAFLTKEEIAKYVFFNDKIAKAALPDVFGEASVIIRDRELGVSNTFPSDDDLEALGCYWKQCKRQIREMVKVLCWSGCVEENSEDGTISIKYKDLSSDNKADIFDILTCTERWLPPQGKTFPEIKESYQAYMDVTQENVDSGVPENKSIKYITGIKNMQPRNRIFFGAPGTGKSFTLNSEKDKLLVNKNDYERVTFHPDYSYSNFVGTYKPVPCGQDSITYEFVPGPFMRSYVKALKKGRTNDASPFLLIIEEINRANVAAVFGDIFQLLDRGFDYVSEYPIQATEDIKKYLALELGGIPSDYSEIKIPDNMFIWATMNSADQGVFPMDTAFKRRWDFRYIGIDDSEDGIKKYMVTLGTGDYQRHFNWNGLRKAINDELLTYKVNEDKLMGPYFISKSVLPEEGTEIDAGVFKVVFKNKVLMYLFEDAAKQKRETLFGGCDDKTRKQYSKICEAFDERGVFIFCDRIANQFSHDEQGE